MNYTTLSILNGDSRAPKYLQDQKTFNELCDMSSIINELLAKKDDDYGHTTTIHYQDKRLKKIMSEIDKEINSSELEDSLKNAALELKKLFHYSMSKRKNIEIRRN